VGEKEITGKKRKPVTNQAKVVLLLVVLLLLSAD
jgi:hypothetical protein